MRVTTTGREQGFALARDRVLSARYERYRTVRHPSCESSSAATLQQSDSERKAEDSSGPRAVSKIINDQHAIPRIVMLLTGKTSSEARFTASDSTPFEKLPDEVSASTRRSIIFFVLSALVGSTRASCSKANGWSSTCT